MMLPRAPLRFLLLAGLLIMARSGRRGGGRLRTSGSFTMNAGDGHRAGNGELGEPLSRFSEPSVSLDALHAALLSHGVEPGKVAAAFRSVRASVPSTAQRQLLTKGPSEPGCEHEKVIIQRLLAAQERDLGRKERELGQDRRMAGIDIKEPGSDLDMDAADSSLEPVLRRLIAPAGPSGVHDLGASSGGVSAAENDKQYTVLTKEREKLGALLERLGEANKGSSTARAGAAGEMWLSWQRLHSTATDKTKKAFMAGFTAGSAAQKLAEVRDGSVLHTGDNVSLLAPVPTVQQQQLDFPVQQSPSPSENKPEEALIEYDHIYSANIALNKPTEQSSTEYLGQSTKAVDGIRKNDWKDGSISSTKTETNPWFKVDLQRSETVKAVRITNRGDCCGARLDLATIKVGTHTCSRGVVVPQGETGDFVCDPPLKGSTVKVELHGQGHMLSMAELEVFQDPKSVKVCDIATAKFKWSQRINAMIIMEQHGSTDECYDFETAKRKCEQALDCHGIASQSNICSGKYRVTHGVTATLKKQAVMNAHAYTVVRNCKLVPAPTPPEVCYDGKAYATEGCTKCSGPGPSQCTACHADAALVPWRNSGREGTCQSYTKVMQVREIPGTGSLSAMLMASSLGKWGLQEGTATLPATNGIGVPTVQLTVTCKVRKAVWCAARSNVMETHNCNVEKEATLHSVADIAYTPSVALQKICNEAGGRPNPMAKASSCLDVPPNNLTMFTSAVVKSPHDACAAVVKLL